MMTSTELSGSGMFSISPFRNSTLARSLLRFILFGQRQHFINHVETVRFPSKADAASGKQDINPATGTKIEHGFTGLQFRKGSGVAAT
jgi:hypothetical protein